MKRMLWTAALICLLTMTGCNISIGSPGPMEIPLPTVTALDSSQLNFDLTPVVPTNPLPPIETATPPPTQTSLPAPVNTSTSAPPVAQNPCTDPAMTALIDSLKRAVLTSDGALFGSLISPGGWEVRYFRDGRVIKYTPYQTQFLFESTYVANWGPDPNSGIEKKGSFHDVIIPELAQTFDQTYTLHCNEIRTGGATYTPKWPYSKDFYSIHFAGTEAYGYLDWHTWVVGVEYVNGKPCIYALIQYYWEA